MVLVFRVLFTDRTIFEAASSIPVATGGWGLSSLYYKELMFSLKSILQIEKILPHRQDRITKQEMHFTLFMRRPHPWKIY